MSSASQVKLKNGLEISHMGNMNVDWQMSYDIVKQYFGSSTNLCKGDTIIDVGANVGLFSLSAYERCNGNLCCYAFEPIPANFSLLQQNFKKVDNQNLKAVQIGLSNIDGDLTFNYYPNASCLSTHSQEYIKELEDMMNSVDKYKDKLTMCFGIQGFDSDNQRFSRLRAILAIQMALKSEKIKCKVKRLSTILLENGIKKVDLLKIDAVGCEFEVLSGIDKEDWPKIQQLLIKIRYNDPKLESIIKMLKEQGFIINQSEKYSSDFEGMAFCIICALR